MIVYLYQSEGSKNKMNQQTSTIKGASSRHRRGFHFIRQYRQRMIEGLGFLIAIGMLGASVEAFADSVEMISFESAPPVISEFKRKRAEERGESLTPSKGLLFKGQLHKPEGESPYSAILLIHGCLPQSDWLKAWTTRLTDWGYAVLSFDAFAPRGIGALCDAPSSLHGGQRVRDIEGALHFLAGRKDIAPDQIGALSITHGSWSLLYALTPTMNLQPPFRAAVALYPLCGLYSGFSAPTWILQGAQHDPSAASRCEDFALSVPNPHGTTLRTYPDGAHLIESYWADDDGANNLAHRVNEQDLELIDEIKRFFAEHLR